MTFNSALTSGNYDSLRGTTSVSPSHHARLSLSLCPNTNIYTARVNQAVFASSFAQFTYDGGSGTLANVRAGQTVLISHTNDRTKAFFVGRVRKTPTSTILYINETSAAFADDDYVFVLDDYAVRDKLARYASSTIYPDYEIAFRQLPPRIYNLRSAYMGEASGGALSFSYAPTVAATADGATISSYLWEVDDGTFTAGNSTTKDVTVSFPPGFRHIHFSTTDSGGRTSTRHIPVWVHDDTYPVTLLDHGDLQINATLEDGYSGSVTAFDSVDTLLDNTLVCAWLADEHYNETQTNIVSNIVLVGRLRTEANQTTYEENQQRAETRFEIEGPLQQLARLEITSLQIDNKASPTKFNQVKTLTVWREIFLVLSEYSTFHELHSLDFDDATDTFREKGIVTQQGNLLSVVNALANGVNAAIQTNAAGEAEVVRNACMISTGSRSSLVTVGNWTTADILAISLARAHARQVGRVDASGGTFNSTSSRVTPALAIAPGIAPDYPEGTQQLANQILTANLSLAAAETEIMERAGHALAKAQDADELTIVHPDGYWWLTPSANQWYTFTLAGTETVRGIVLTTSTRWQLISTTVTHEIETGTRSVEAVYRKETSGTPGQKVRYPPQTSNPITLPEFPPLPPFPAFDIGAFFLPDSLTTAIVPATLSGTMAPIIRHDGNTVLCWTAAGAHLANDFILQPTPSWKEITPPLISGEQIVQCRFIPGTTPGALIATSLNTISLGSFNFVTGKQGWDVALNCGFVRGVYTAGVGFEDTLDASTCSGATFRTIYLSYALSNTFFVSTVEIDYVFTAGSCEPLQTCAYLGVMQNETTAYVSTTPSDGTHTATLTVNQYLATLLILMNTGSKFGGDPGGSATITGIRVYTIGGRVWHTTQVFNPTVVWTVGQSVADIPLLMRIGSTFADVFLYDPATNHVYYSSNYGATFGAAINAGATPGSVAGFDTQRLGAVTLVSASGQIRRATTQGGAYSDYGTTFPASASPYAIWIPRYTFAGGNNGIGVSNVDYLVASPSQSVAYASLWKVTASGVTFTDITPDDAGTKGMAVGPNCLAMPWVLGGYQDILAILSFAATRKLARSINGGSAWAFSAALNGAAAFVTTRRSDLLHKQAFIANGADLGYCSDFHASPPVFSTRTGPDANTTLGLDVLP